MRVFIITFIGCLFSLLILPSVSSATTIEKKATAIFAGGCFWCLEADFDKVPGVIKTVSGYTGGTIQNPSYENVSQGSTGHFEAVYVEYNPSEVSYQKLLNVFWHSVDPTNSTGQFCDKGDQYRSAIFYQDKKQKTLSEKSKNDLLKSGRFKNIATTILPATTFYPAETYHQDYYQKNPIRYKYYRYRCGRDQRLKEVWGTL